MTTKTTDPAVHRPTTLEIPEPNIARFLFSDVRMAPLWTLVRLYVGYEWLTSGWGKATNPAGVWVGAKAGAAVTGFLTGALGASYVITAKAKNLPAQCWENASMCV